MEKRLCSLFNNSYTATLRQVCPAKRFLLFTASFWALTGIAAIGSAQAPTLGYSSPQTYAVTIAATLTPTSSGVATGGYSSTPVTLGFGFSSPGGVAVDASGNVYVGDANNNEVKEIPAGGGAPVIIGSGFSYPGGVAVDAAGNVYVADYGHSEVKEIQAVGGATVSIGTGFSSPTGVAVDAAGNVYVADAANGAVKKIKAVGGATVTLATGFNFPTGVAVDGAGNVYVADEESSTLKEIQAVGGVTVTIGPTFSGEYGPNGVAVDGAGNVYVADRYEAIQEIPTGGGSAISIGPSVTGLDGIAVNAAGNLYTANFISNVLQEIPPVGGYYLGAALPAGLSFNGATGVISGTPTAVSPATNYTITAYNTNGGTPAVVNIQVIALPSPAISYSGPQTYLVNTAITQLAPASSWIAAAGYNSTPTILVSGFSDPVGVALDKAGNIYVSGLNNTVIKKYPAGGGSTAVNIGAGLSFPFGLAVDATGNVYVTNIANSTVNEVLVSNGSTISIGSGFDDPTGVAVDAAGNVYVADEQHNAIKEIPVNGGSIVKLGSGFDEPLGVTVDATGNVYVADQEHNAVKEIQANGGSTISIGSGFKLPSGVAVDAAGNVYVGDYGNNAVKEIGSVSGSTVSIGSGFMSPAGVALDTVGNVYVADENNSAVKKIIPTGGYYLSKALPAGLSFNSATGVISGTPTAVSPETNYTITAYNSLGSASATVNIKVSLTGSSDAILDNIALSNGTLSPTFSSGTNTYTAGVPNGTNSITVTPTTDNSGATVTVNGNSPSTPVGLNVGPNTITIVVTAQDGVTKDTYTLTVTEAPSSDATLSNLTLSSGTLVPGFSSGTNTYSASVGNGTNSITVTPTTDNSGATVTVNGNSPSVPVSLNVGANMITVLVTAQDGVTQNTYTVTVIEAASSNANLSALTSSSGALNPAFVSGTTAYTAPDITAESVTITPTLQDTTATLTINGTAATSGTATPVALSAGSNTITVAVTAADGTTVNNYTIAITRIIPAVPSISYTGPQVYPTGTAISPLTPTGSGVAAFAYGVGTTTLTTALNSPTGIATDASGNLFVANIGDGTIYKLTGGTGTPAAFSAGFNTPFNITTDATGNVYVADVGNAAIEEIPSAGGTLVPFATGSIGATGVAVDAQGNVYATNTVTTSLYKIPAGGTVTTLSSIFSNPYDVAADNKGNLYVADNNSGTGTIDKFSTSGTSAGSVGSGFQYPSSVITDNQGNVYVADASSVKMVPAGGGSTVTLASGFSGLFGIALGQAGAIYVTDNAATAVEKLNPVGGYYISPALPAGLVFNNTTGVISGTPTVVSPATTYTITGYNSGGGTSSTVSIQVTPPSALLSALTLSSGTLNPAFTPAGISYTASVPNTTSTINVTPTTQDPTATVTVNGNSSTTPVNLNVGPNSIAVLVTASDGVTKKTYTVTVTVAAPSYSTLSNFSFSVGTHPPVFVPGQTSYADTLNTSITAVAITPYTTSATATVTINGAAVTSGSPSQPIALFEGQTSTATIVVTAAGGSSQTTYTVTIYRLPSTNAHLSFLSVKGVPISPGFAGTTTGYTASVTNATSSVTLTPTVADANATVTVNGVAVASGTSSQSIPLIVGNNTINTIVTSQGGTTLTYTVVITRGPSAIATLSNLTLSRGGLSPGFGPSKTSYTTLVGETVTSIIETPTVTDPTATITVNGTALTSGTATNPILLNIGANVITTVVTAQDGSTIDTYTVTVTRQPSSNAKLGFLGLSHVVLSPAFAVATTGYTASVSNSLTSTNVLPILVDTTARIAVNGIAVASGASTPVTLIVGTNVINTVVTAQDGVTQITYTVTVTRAAPPSAAYVTYEPVSVEKPTDGPQLVDDDIVVHQGVSPNGDGIDDYLQIDGITNYPDNKLTIINRSGMLVYEAKGYDNSSRTFDGHSNQTGQMQLPGTYFYSLDYTIDGVTKHKTGFLVLKY